MCFAQLLVDVVVTCPNPDLAATNAESPVSNDCRSSDRWFVVFDCIADGKQFRECEGACVYLCVRVCVVAVTPCVVCVGMMCVCVCGQIHLLV